MLNWFKKKRNFKVDCPTVRVIDSCEDPRTQYIEFPDGLRLIIRDGKYDGHYVA